MNKTESNRIKSISVDKAFLLPLWILGMDSGQPSRSATFLGFTGPEFFLQDAERKNGPGNVSRRDGWQGIGRTGTKSSGSFIDLFLSY